MHTKFQCMTAEQARALYIKKPIVMLCELNEKIENAIYKHENEITITDKDYEVPDEILWAMNERGYILDIHTSRIPPFIKYYTFRW